MITPFYDTASVAVRQQLDPSERALGQAMERLASGLRINRAADDASGQATAATLTARARSWDAARRSVEAGMDLARIATGGLSGASDTLIRLRELATQAANGTLDDTQRESMQRELDGLGLQLDEIAASTRYNGRTLLTPHRVDIAFVVDSSGTMGGELASLVSAVQNFRTELATSAVGVQFGLAEVRQTIDVTDGVRRRVDIGAPGFDASLGSITLATGAIDPYSAILETSGATSVAGTSDPDAFAWSPVAAERHLVYISDGGREIDLVPGPDSETSIATAVSNLGIQVHAIVPPAANNIFDTITSGTGGTLSSLGDASGSGIAAALDALADEIAARAPSDTLDIQTGVSGSSQDFIASGLPVDASRGGLGLFGLTIATQADARDALARIDAAIETVAGHQARVGSLSQRLDTALSEARTSHFTAESGRSRIQDADIAEAETQRVAAQLRLQSTAEALLRSADIQRDAILSLLSP